MDEEERKLIEEYNADVKWLRDRIPPDDIYDFAQQMLMAAECILVELGSHNDVQSLMNKDALLNSRINMVMSIYFMKRDGFKGIINTSYQIGRK